MPDASVRTCCTCCVLQEVLYAKSRQWGVQVERVELKELTLPFNLQRSMASEAEAARTARAKVLTNSQTQSCFYHLKKVLH